MDGEPRVLGCKLTSVFTLDGSSMLGGALVDEEGGALLMSVLNNELVSFSFSVVAVVKFEAAVEVVGTTIQEDDGVSLTSTFSASCWLGCVSVLETCHNEVENNYHDPSPP